MQLRDVRNLLKTVSDIDRAYMKEWVAKLGLEETYREVS
jgi:hypothetical protein